MSRLLAVIAVGATLMFVVGCWATSSTNANASMQQLKRRASFDLNCPAEKVTVLPLDPRTRGVRGCDRQATYVEVCKETGGDLCIADCGCTWVLNGPAMK